MKRYILPIIIILASVIMSVSIFLLNADTKDLNVFFVGNDKKELKFIPGTPDNVRIPDDSDHILGNPNAPIKIIEFSDLECAFCKAFHKTMWNIMATYGKDGQVAWIYRHFPIDSLHSKSRTEAIATECAGEIGGPSAFWEYIDKIFEVTPSKNGLDLSILPNLAEGIGLDRDKFEECLSSGRYDLRIESDLNDAINSGANGAPYSIAILKNGKTFLIPGSKNSNIISAILKKALNELE